MTTQIYGLFDPRTEELKYIGKANCVTRRVKDHMLDFRGVPVDRLCWLEDLKRNKLKPVVEILEEVDVKDWQFWEEFYIGYFKSLGINLLQKRNGKNGLTFANSQTFRKGHKPWNKNKIKMGNTYV